MVSTIDAPVHSEDRVMEELLVSIEMDIIDIWNFNGWSDIDDETWDRYEALDIIYMQLHSSRHECDTAQ